jgi:hypothetical protein
LVCDPSWHGAEDLDGFRVFKLAKRNTASFKQIIDIWRADIPNQAVVLLQYAPYGFQKRGCPVWLCKALDSEAMHHIDLAVLFHELANHDRRIWKSSFWLSGLQEYLIGRLANSATTRITNTVAHQSALTARGFANVHHIRNFSTIGEPSQVPSFQSRRKQMVVFGRPWQRNLTYTLGRDALANACRAIDAERIVDIGGPLLEPIGDTVAGIPVLSCGSLPASEVGRWLSESRGCFLRYPASQLAKSSVFASTSSFGAIPFVLEEEERIGADRSEFRRGTDFVAVDDTLAPQDEETWACLADVLFKNYQKRSSKVAATQLLQFFDTANPQ